MQSSIQLRDRTWQRQERITDDILPFLCKTGQNQGWGRGVEQMIHQKLFTCI
jgi:hypothetical protein